MAFCGLSEAAIDSDAGDKYGRGMVAYKSDA
jgi:hypothetical protein